MNTQRMNAQARAVYEHSKNAYEQVRDIVDTYKVNTGDVNAVNLPPWYELSDASQNQWIQGYGNVVLPAIMAVLMRIPECQG